MQRRTVSVTVGGTVLMLLLRLLWLLLNSLAGTWFVQSSCQVDMLSQTTAASIRLPHLAFIGRLGTSIRVQHDYTTSLVVTVTSSSSSSIAGLWCYRLHTAQLNVHRANKITAVSATRQSQSTKSILKHLSWRGGIVSTRCRQEQFLLLNSNDSKLHSVQRLPCRL